MAPNVLVRRISDAKAVALVLGPLGTTAESTMNGFGKMYYQDRKITTITAASPFVRFLLTQHRTLKPTAITILKETASALGATPSEVPLVVHLYSNGGAFLLEEMELLMSEVEEAKKLQSVSSTDADTDGVESDKLTWEEVELVQQRMEYQFFDSCPCFLHMIWDISPYYGNAFPNPAWHPGFQKFYHLGSAFSISMWSTFTGSFQRSSQFWSRMEHIRPYCKHQIYVYTTADMLCDATRVDELIEKRRQAPHNDTITTRRYDDSGHTVIYRDHEDEYNQVVDESLESALARRQQTSTAE